jgi:hypothetical protein
MSMSLSMKTVKNKSRCRWTIGSLLITSLPGMFVVRNYPIVCHRSFVLILITLAPISELFDGPIYRTLDFPYMGIPSIWEEVPNELRIMIGGLVVPSPEPKRVRVIIDGQNNHRWTYHASNPPNYIPTVALSEIEWIRSLAAHLKPAPRVNNVEIPYLYLDYARDTLAFLYPMCNPKNQDPAKNAMLAVQTCLINSPTACAELQNLEIELCPTHQTFNGILDPLSPMTALQKVILVEHNHCTTDIGFNRERKQNEDALLGEQIDAGAVQNRHYEVVIRDKFGFEQGFPPGS